MMTTRQAKVTDIPALVELLWDDPQGSLRENPSDEARPKYLAAVNEIVSDPNCHLLVAVEGNRVVGCVQINILTGMSYQGIRRGLIEDMRIARTCRGTGYSRAMLDAACEHAFNKGCKMIELFVHEDRKEAHTFYEACGFAGHHKGYRRQLPDG